MDWTIDHTSSWVWLLRPLRNACQNLDEQIQKDIAHHIDAICFALERYGWQLPKPAAKIQDDRQRNDAIKEINIYLTNGFEITPDMKYIRDLEKIQNMRPLIQLGDALLSASNELYAYHLEDHQDFPPSEKITNFDNNLLKLLAYIGDRSGTNIVNLYNSHNWASHKLPDIE